MEKRRQTGGIAIFIVIAILALAAAFVAFSSTGSKGIEERFEDAVGLSQEPVSSGDAEGGAFGSVTEQDESGEGRSFSLEGNPALYGIILLLLLGIGLLVYRTHAEH